ncbi:hypothetical protein C0J52_11221 [Blattella germanica]|nr:hypothetical protein C0J52_11221 [Blattella germanica]
MKVEDYSWRLQFCTIMQEAMMDEDFAAKLIFSGKWSFHLSRVVNCHNVRIWGTQNPHAFVTFQRYSLKLNVFCVMSQRKVYGPFLFCVNTVTGIS